MIFDSPQMVYLREKYRDLPLHEVPKVVFLDRITRYYGEKLLLEELFKSVSLNKQKDWFGRLINEESEQHIGAWFEIMLYGWLKEHFIVQVEPELMGNYPDFTLDIQGNPLVIEARAFLITQEEREKQSKYGRIISTLESIKKPFTVRFKIKRLGEKINSEEFIKRVNHWLEFSSDQDSSYEDNLGNILSLYAEPSLTLKKIGVISTPSMRVNSDNLKPSLSEKATQHKALRKAGYPYVIAIFLESPYLTAEEVSEAWFGKTAVVLDVDTNQVVEEKFDQKGIHFFGNEIRHKSVSGTLVFREGYDDARHSRYLQSWYIQNPYANVKLNPDIFPAESRFIVVRQNDKIFEMKWVKQIS